MKINNEWLTIGTTVLLNAGNVKKIKEDFWGKQEGRPDVNDFNNGLPRW
ncbi:hypothetical protein [uncultured Streptococcus sp.]|nr:hypothetical protein [uncultured Streptococcus sp.]